MEDPRYKLFLSIHHSRNVSNPAICLKIVLCSYAPSNIIRRGARWILWGEWKLERLLPANSSKIYYSFNRWNRQTRAYIKVNECLIFNKNIAMQNFLKAIILPLLLVSPTLAICPGFNYAIGNVEALGGGVNRCRSSLILCPQLIRCRECLWW